MGVGGEKRERKESLELLCGIVTYFKTMLPLLMTAQNPSLLCSPLPLSFITCLHASTRHWNSFPSHHSPPLSSFSLLSLLLSPPLLSQRRIQTTSVMQS